MDRMTAVLCVGLLVTGCASHKVTVEDSVEGRVAVYALKVVEATKAVTDAVKAAEAQSLIATSDAAQVVRAGLQIDTVADELGALLEVYDAFTRDTPPEEVRSQLELIRRKVGEIAVLTQALLVPVNKPEIAQQIGALTAKVNETLITLALELAKGVQ